MLDVIQFWMSANILHKGSLLKIVWVYFAMIQITADFQKNMEW